jgi:hypothetical protein
VTQRDHLVENYSQGPEVRGSAAQLARNELGGEIEGCSQNGGLRVPAVAADRGAPKSGNGPSAVIIGHQWSSVVISR